MGHLTDKERVDLASNLRWHFACHAAEPDKGYASLGIENAVLRVEALIARHRAEAAAEALLSAADDVTYEVRQFEIGCEADAGYYDAHMEIQRMLRDRADRIGGQS